MDRRAQNSTQGVQILMYANDYHSKSFVLKRDALQRVLCV
jgi:hypothetical protein